MVIFGEIPQNSCNAALVVDVINKITNKITKTKTAGRVPTAFYLLEGVLGVGVQRTADHFLKTLRLRTFPPRPTRGHPCALRVPTPTYVNPKSFKKFLQYYLAEHN